MDGADKLKDEREIGYETQRVMNVDKKRMGIWNKTEKDVKLTISIFMFDFITFLSIYTYRIPKLLSKPGLDEILILIPMYFNLFN